MRKILPFCLLVAATSCGDDGQSGPGGVPPSDAKALDEAAEIVEHGRPELPVEEAPTEAKDSSKNESGSE